MGIIRQYAEIFNKADEIEKTHNFNFVRHQCPVKGEDIRIELDNMIIKQFYAKEYIKVLRFGACPECGKMYYNEEDNKSIFIR